jgi:ribonuclease I
MLLVEWPSFSLPNHEFWEHEWLKHGTCARMASELVYFKTSLHLLQRMPILSALANAGIVPSEREKVSYIRMQSAIKEELKVPALIACHKRNYLSEIRICIAKDWKFIECSQEVKRDLQENMECNPDGIWFFPIVHN